MYPLLFTTAFLLLMSLFASSEISQYRVGQLEKKLYESQLAAYKLCQEEKCAAKFAQFEGTCEKNKGEGPKGKENCACSLKYSLLRPPNNAKLNFYLLLHAPNQSFYPEGFSIYETAAVLLRTLYERCTFYYPDLEYQILNALLEQKEKSKELLFPDDLAAIELDDPDLQRIFLRMLKGGHLRSSYPSLLEYITFDKEGSRYEKMVNFLFASDELLYAIFKNERLVVSLAEARGELWDRVKKQEEGRHTILQRDALGRREVKALAKGLYEKCLCDYGIDPKHYHNIFEFSLGKKGTILYIQDPLTHTFKREKLPKKKL